MKKRTGYLALTIAGVGASVIAAFSSYDYFINPKGGLFCPDHNSIKEFRFDLR